MLAESASLLAAAAVSANCSDEPALSPFDEETIPVLLAVFLPLFGGLRHWQVHVSCIFYSYLRTPYTLNYS